MSYKSDYSIAKFWYRIGAIFIDTIILGFIGFILSILFERNFRMLGEYGVFVGFAISLIYFTLFNSPSFRIFPSLNDKMGLLVAG